MHGKPLGYPGVEGFTALRHELMLVLPRKHAGECPVCIGLLAVDSFMYVDLLASSVFFLPLVVFASDLHLLL